MLLHIGKLTSHCRINYSATAVPDQLPPQTFYSRIILEYFESVLIIP